MSTNEENRTSATVLSNASMSSGNHFYLISTLLLTIILPVAWIIGDLLSVRNLAASWSLVGRWFLFWGVGIRLFTAGLSQIARPSFTLRSIFQIKSLESAPIVRELGFSNLGIGIAGIISVLLVPWRVPAAFIACVFLGAAALQHALKKPASGNEWVALVTDAIIFFVLAGFLTFSLV